ncbi:MAG: hypothetical protein FGM24_01575 [Candidatus Kapabacteria bacterium]|nr:hypothetical protein [Candidatus Kapabacteria bacterium]
MATPGKPSWLNADLKRDLLYCGAILLAVVVFFSDAIFGGKNFLGESDNVAFFSFIPYLESAKDTGEFPLWMPYIFSGMPSLASFLAAGERSWDIVLQVLFALPRMLGNLADNDTARIGMWYTVYGWGVYALLRSKQQERMVALFSALAAIFSTFVIVWIMIGHSTKPVALATLPWLFLALERIRTNFTLTNLFILTLPLIALVGATHPQMMFYIGVAVALYMVVELIMALASKQGAMSVLRTGGALAIAAGLALATHADMLLSTRSYTPYSTRGSAPLVQSAGNKQDASGGNDYEYATNWSFSPEEMMTFLVPNYYGFGKMEVDVNGRQQRLMMYWGQMRFTDAANYMGIGVLLLAILGLWYHRRDPLVIALGAISVVSLLLSFGKNFPLLYDVFFYNVPSFNKFRAPQIALAMLQFAIPVLAGYGLTSVLRWNRESTPTQRRTAMIIGGLCTLFFLWGMVAGGGGKQSYVEQATAGYVEKGYPQDQAGFVAELAYDAMSSDWTQTGLIAVAFAAIILLLVHRKIKPVVAMPLLVLLTVIDLWRVDYRPYDPQKTNVERTVFRRTDVVDFLKNDKTPYRIADFSPAPPNSWARHFIEHVHGYSSAKLRVYQDMLDVAGAGPLRPGERVEDRAGNSMVTNPFMWDLLNVKYIVSDRPIFPNAQPAFASQETGQLVYANQSALPRAWFVDTLVAEKNGMTILEHLRDGTFNPRSRAYVEDAAAVKVLQRDSAATVQRTEVGNQRTTFSVRSASAGFVVFSEVYYPEWHAYVDGNEVPMYKTNFLLRGVHVPAGTHTVEFKFISPEFEQGRMISMAANGIILLIGALGMFVSYRNRQRGEA